MRKFVYVVAYLTEDAAAEEDYGCLSFTHKFIEALDEEQAYSIGMRSLDGDVEATGGVPVNNYVIEIPG